MSKGTNIISLRMPPATVAKIHAAIEAANGRTRGELYSFSCWILTACEEKLRHLERSRKKTPPTLMDDEKRPVEQPKVELTGEQT